MAVEAGDVAQVAEALACVQHDDPPGAAAEGARRLAALVNGGHPINRYQNEKNIVMEFQAAALEANAVGVLLDSLRNTQSIADCAVIMVRSNPHAVAPVACQL